ncbi:hypothetical protein [Xenorhabdus bovienii]|uniref:hypothetical protein n=1 Tax=Xenorhabdus bovienii TaxID=40576 RepID=UPI003DA4499D
MANSMTLSLPNNTDLIIGQHFLFTVTLTSEKVIPSSTIVSFTQTKNITVPSGNISMNFSKNGKLATVTVELSVPDSVKENEKIKFTVTVNEYGFSSENMCYTARKIDIESLSLTVDKQYLDTPVVSDNNNPSTEMINTRIYTTIRDKIEKSLSGVPVFITSSELNKLDDFKIYAADNRTIVKTQKFGPHSGAFINADNDGKVIFYLYPQKSLSVILNLVAVLPGIYGGEAAAKTTLYVVNSQPIDYEDSLGWPNILDYNSGTITASPGIPLFDVIIDPYPGAASGDTILFFINNKYTGHAITINDTKLQLGNPAIRLPYQMFEYGVLSNFSYVVIRQLVDMLASLPLPVTYMGGVPYEPYQNVPRNYERCIVHTSLGVAPDNIIPNNNAVNYAAIMKYPNGQGKGLYIEILGTKDPNQKYKVPINTSVTLNLYLNSVNKNYIKSYQGTVVIQNSGTDKNQVSAIIHVPFDDLVNVKEYDGGSAGNIYFDYVFSINGQKEYGKVWEAVIETIPEIGDDDLYDNN